MWDDPHVAHSFGCGGVTLCLACGGVAAGGRLPGSDNLQGAGRCNEPTLSGIGVRSGCRSADRAHANLDASMSQPVTDIERQRAARIAANRERLAQLGLPQLSAQIAQERADEASEAAAAEQARLQRYLPSPDRGVRRYGLRASAQRAAARITGVHCMPREFRPCFFLDWHHSDAQQPYCRQWQR